MGYVVLDHRLEEQNGLYRVVVAWEDIVEVPAALSDDGSTILDEAGNPLIGHEKAYSDLRDYVFSADDERWHGLSRDEVAAQQRQIVSDAMAAAAEAAGPSVSSGHELPGIGEPL